MAFKDRFQAFTQRSRVVLLGTLAALVVIWVLFFDSHSILTRIQLMAQRSELKADNEILKARVAELEEKLGRPLTAWDIEELAREEYGMSRDGETVYPLIEE